MKTLEQYGIKDVTPDKSVGCSERLRGVFECGGGGMSLFVGDTFVGRLSDAKYNNKVVDGDSMYVSSGSSVWVRKVEYN